jgi:hypothetical protein
MKACRTPPFLESRPNHELPNPADYVDFEYGAGFYDRLLLEYEQTKLRELFLAEMADIEPQWLAIHSTPSDRAELDLAITLCDAEMSQGRIQNWLDDIESGSEGPSLSARFDYIL